MASEASNHLAVNLLKALPEKEPGNIFVSPFSLASCVSMLYCGARDDNAAEIIKVLGLSDISTEELQSSLEKTAGAYSLECANAAVLQQNNPVKEEYRNLLETSFHATIMEEDFANDGPAVVERINMWIENKTHGMINKVLKSLDPLTVLVLLNAIYFKGTWKKRFIEEFTCQQKFYNKGSEENAKDVDMMYRKGKFDHADLGTFQVLQLPYKGDDIAMLVLLPKSSDGLQEMEGNLAQDFVKNLREKMQMTHIRVSFPKFHIEYYTSLKGTFQQLGMCKAFERGANFKGISDDIFTTDIFHKAVIEVTEEGTEAAAVTGAVCVSLGVPQQKEPEFIVDHPFLFTIYNTRDYSNLFIGKIVEL